jgi:hypothetical protein
MNASWLPKTKEEESFRVEFKDLDITLIDALIVEINAYVEPTTEVVEPTTEVVVEPTTGA